MADEITSEDDLYFWDNEEKDVQAFQRFVTPYYHPCNKPVAMAVGALMPTERSAIKVYHKRQFGIPIEDTRVAACNIHEAPPSMSISKRFKYDSECFGCVGNAITNYPYEKTLAELNQGKRRFDLVYIRNPDFIRNMDWAYVFKKALEWTTSKGGVVVTLVRREDVRKYQNLLTLLQGLDVTPVFSGETGIPSFEHLPDDDFHNTMGVFKPTHYLE